MRSAPMRNNRLRLQVGITPMKPPALLWIAVIPFFVGCYGPPAYYGGYGYPNVYGGYRLGFGYYGIHKHHLHRHFDGGVRKNRPYDNRFSHQRRYLLPGRALEPGHALERGFGLNRGVPKHLFKNRQHHLDRRPFNNRGSVFRRDNRIDRKPFGHRSPGFSGDRRFYRGGHFTPGRHFGRGRR